MICICLIGGVSGDGGRWYRAASHGMKLALSAAYFLAFVGQFRLKHYSAVKSKAETDVSNIDCDNSEEKTHISPASIWSKISTSFGENDLWNVECRWRMIWVVELVSLLVHLMHHASHFTSFSSIFGCSFGFVSRKKQTTTQPIRHTTEIIFKNHPKRVNIWNSLNINPL